MAEILRRALERQQRDADSSADAISHDDLVAAAREAGIDPAAIESAALEVSHEKSLEVSDASERAPQRQRFYGHLATYAIVNTFLFALDMLVTHGTWFYWVLLGWGLGVALQAVRVFLPRQETPAERAARIERAERVVARRLEREAKRSRRAARREAKQRVIRGAEQFETVVQEGVATLLESLARRMKSHLPAESSPPRVFEPPPSRVRVADASLARGAGPDLDDVARDADGLHQGRARRG